MRFGCERGGREGRREGGNRCCSQCCLVLITQITFIKVPSIGQRWDLMGVIWPTRRLSLLCRGLRTDTLHSLRYAVRRLSLLPTDSFVLDLNVAYFPQSS